MHWILHLYKFIGRAFCARLERVMSPVISMRRASLAHFHA